MKYEDILTALDNAGLELVEVYGDMTLEKPKSEEERIFYITRKK